MIKHLARRFFRQPHTAVTGMLTLTAIALFMIFSSPGRMLTILWNEALWHAHPAPHYQYTFRNMSFSNANHIYDVRIEVRDGQTIAVTRKETNTIVDPVVFAEYDTIPKVFTRLKHFAQANPRWFWVRYHWWTGIPEQADITLSSSTDSAYVLTLTEYEVLP